MFNLTRVSVLVVVCSMTTTVFSQSRTTITGARASAIVSSAQQVITDRENNPTFIRFQENTPVRELAYLKEGMGLDDACDMQISASHKDELGFQHVKYQETYEGLRIVGAEYIFHVKGSSVINGNGRVYREVNVNTNPALTEEQALNQALLEIDANAYMWESKEEETLLRQTTNDPTATYYPSGELAISSANYDPSEALQLAYIFDIYATDPLGRFEVEVDAHTGEILNKYDKIHHTAAVGSGTTLYDGDVPLQVTQHGGHYHLTETTRGNGIHTYDMNNGTNYSDATIFQEGDSYFDEPTSIAGVSAHFGAGATYDYFYNNHGRNSFDDRGAAIRSYVHYSTNYVNAFWDGSRMTYGDGNGTSITPLVSLDIVGHEIVHALTQYSAGLIYMNESGALNESFSDIFGQSIEFETFPATASWNLGDQIFTNGRSMIRSLSDPKSQGQPDTYFGERWFTGSDNNGGVHTNSGVQNYWYYLLVEGGSGTNDYGYNYGVPSIGRAAADAIAYRNLTVYLTASSNYIDARAGAEQSAIDLFGENSPQHLAVIEAWNAVGVPSVEPVLTVASALDFGNGIVNNTATLDLAIRNDGYSDLSITRIEVNNAVFVPATSTLTIASLATEKLEIAFSPTANQPYSGQMTIYSNADTVTVSLSGTGVQMPSFTLSQDYFDLTHAAGELASYPITITNNNSFGLNFSFDTDAPQNATPTFIPTSTKLKVGKGEVEAFRAVPSLKGEDVGSGYRWQDSGEGVAFDWLDIEGIGTTVTLGDDDNSDYIDLGFDFDFFEQAHNSISIGSNGWLSFTVNSFGLWSLPLPAPQAPANVIAWMAHDLYPGGPCIYYQDAANERFIVQYTNWTDWTTRTGSYTVQVQIYKSGKILMLYQTVVNPVGGVIGIQNQFKAQGLTVAYNDPSFFRNNYAVEISRIPRWLQASQEEIFVPANTSRAFTAEINTTRLIAGDYSAKLLLGLPDYNTLVDEVQFDLTVDGRANLLVPGNLSFGNGNVGQEKLETLEIVNNGSEDILISSIAFDNGTNFSTTAGSFTVRAQQEANIDVRFVAPGLGEYTDVLRINTNDPDVPQKAVTLVGRGTLAPVLSTDPTSLSVTLAQGASTTRTIVVSNIDNADDLTFSVGYRNVETVLGKSQTFVGSAPVADDKVAEPAVSEPPIYKSTVAAEVSNTIGNNTALSEVKAKLDESYNSITTLIPNRFDFAEGETGTNIGDGGDDLYDGGNFLSTNLAGPIAYSNGRILTHSAFGGSSYFTEKYTGLFVLSADLGGATGFTIDGNLGADGGGSVDGAVLEISRFGKTYLGFVKRVFESGDPSVNHLIIVESNGTATHEFSTNTNDDLHEVSNLSGVDRMYYLLFSAGNNGEYINDATMLNIMETFLGIVDDNSWLSAAQTLGTLAGGEQVGIDFEINASALTPGSYEQNIVFTNSGTPSAVEVPVALQVTGEVLELSLDRSAVAFGNRLLGEQVRDSVLLTNTGDSRATILETTLSHSDFAVEASSFALEPGQSRWIPFVYTAVTEGPVVATAIIRHDGEGGDLRVSLSARGRAPRARLALNRTTINFGTLDVGGVRRDSVQLTNVGDARATIHEVALDHTDFETEATSFTLAINESRWVTFTYTAVTSGPVSTRATIRHDGEGGDGLVNMSGTGRAPTAALSVDRNSINFGEVFLGEQKVDSVQIVNTGRLAARVSEVTLSHSDFAVERLSFTLAADERRWIPFTYTPTMQGPVAVTALIRHDAPGGDIGILLTGDGTEPPLVPTPTINVDPGAINVVIAPDKVVTKSLTIGNRAGTAALDWSLTIDDGVPIPSSPWLSVANTNGSVAAGGAQTIDVSMNSSGLAVGTHTANLRISSNDEDQPLLTVPVSFKVDTIIGELIMSREALYVGQALTSTSITQVVNITNSGDYAVEILNIEGANASFTITPSARVIAVGETAAFDVVFTPRWEGEATAELIWNTNIPLERDLKLVLTGVGVGAYLEPTTHFREFSSDAGEASLVIETNLEQFTASSEADWLTFDYGENDLLNADNLIVRYASNPRAEVRQAAILISGGGLTRSVFVSQEGRNAYIELSRDSVNLLPGHGSFELELSTSLEDWEVFDLPDWIRYRVAGSTLTFLYDSNPLVARTASLEIGHGVTTAKVFVRQEGTAPFLIVPNTTFAIDRMGGDIEVAVQTNTAYVASTEQDWVSIVTTDDGLKVVVDRLISAQPRLATVVLSADQVNDINITVEQLREGVVLDVKDEPEIQFSYYPNPATHQVTVKSRRLQSVRLFTTNGTKITPQMRKLIGSIVMDVRDLQQGLYFMEAELNDGTVQIEKLIIE